MTALTFDTHAAVKEMKGSGLAEAHAESIIAAIQAGMGHLADLATKEDLKDFPTRADLKAELENFATKEDLKDFPTRADLKAELENFATKEDLKNFATKEDLKEIETELKATKAKMEAEFKATKAESKADLERLELHMTVRLGVMIFAVAGLAVAAVRYL